MTSWIVCCRQRSKAVAPPQPPRRLLPPTTTPRRATRRGAGSVAPATLATAATAQQVPLALSLVGAEDKALLLDCELPWDPPLAVVAENAGLCHS